MSLGDTYASSTLFLHSLDKPTPAASPSRNSTWHSDALSSGPRTQITRSRPWSVSLERSDNSPRHSDYNTYTAKIISCYHLIVLFCDPHAGAEPPDLASLPP